MSDFMKLISKLQKEKTEFEINHINNKVVTISYFLDNETIKEHLFESLRGNQLDCSYIKWGINEQN